MSRLRIKTAGRVNLAPQTAPHCTVTVSITVCQGHQTDRKAPQKNNTKNKISIGGKQTELQFMINKFNIKVILGVKNSSEWDIGWFLIGNRGTVCLYCSDFSFGMVPVD